MRARLAGTLITACALVSCSGQAWAWIHVARSGESLEQLAAQYYGRTKLSMVIRAANGFVHPDDGRLTRGERVEIPELIYHRARAEETWSSLADRFLGSSRRGAYLAEMNGSKGSGEPAEGMIIKIPYQLLHILAKDESLRSVVKLYFGSSRSQKWLRGYNLTRQRRFGRGDALLIPLIDVEFVDSERERVENERAQRYSAKDREEQVEAASGIIRLKKAFEKGRYVEMVAISQQMLGKKHLSGPQQIGVYQYLGFAYVALNERNLALDAFAKALLLQPEMELSPITTSPKILSVFREAKRAVLSSDSTADASPEQL